MRSIWENFDHVFEVFQGLFFAFRLSRKDAFGTRLDKFKGTDFKSPIRFYKTLAQNYTNKIFLVKNTPK